MYIYTIIEEGTKKEIYSKEDYIEIDNEQN